MLNIYNLNNRLHTHTHTYTQKDTHTLPHPRKKKKVEKSSQVRNISMTRQMRAKKAQKNNNKKRKRKKKKKEKSMKGIFRLSRSQNSYLKIVLSLSNFFSNGFTGFTRSTIHYYTCNNPIPPPSLPFFF